MIHKVEYLIPGIFMPEDEVRTLERRDPWLAAKQAPPDAYCFTLYDLPDEIPDLGPEYRVIPKRQNVSKRYYIGGSIMTAAEVATLPGDHSILLSNMRGNNWEYVIRCRTGNFQPFEEGDQVLV